MGAEPQLDTARLVLRRWRPEDKKSFAALNADPQVMRHFVQPMTASDSDSFVDRIEAHFVKTGFGLWAVELRNSGDFAGFVGLAVPSFPAAFMPCVEIGWRLAARYWNRGYATEAAAAALTFGFERLALDEVVAFTAVKNAPSRRVMEKLGMERNPADDFDHPRIPEAHPLRQHVLYRLTRRRWQSRRQAGTRQ